MMIVVDRTIVVECTDKPGEAVRQPKQCDLQQQIGT